MFPNQLKCLHRLLLSDNKLKDMQAIQSVLDMSQLAELAMDLNPVTQDPLFRLNVIGSMKNLKLLNAKRIMDEERKGAVRVLKKDQEKKKALDKKQVQLKEKEVCINAIKREWNQQVHGIVDCSQDDGIDTGKTAYMELEGDQLVMIGNGCAIFDRVESKGIRSMSMGYVYFQDITIWDVLSKFDALVKIHLDDVNMKSFKQLEILKKFMSLEELSIAQENPVVKIPSFRMFAIHTLSKVRRLNGKEIMQVEKHDSFKKFGKLFSFRPSSCIARSTSWN